MLGRTYQTHVILSECLGVWGCSCKILTLLDNLCWQSALTEPLIRFFLVVVRKSKCCANWPWACLRLIDHTYCILSYRRCIDCVEKGQHDIREVFVFCQVYQQKANASNLLGMMFITRVHVCMLWFHLSPLLSLFQRGFCIMCLLAHDCTWKQSICAHLCACVWDPFL